MPTWWTNAGVAANAIDAGGAALAGLWRALVHINTAIGPREALGAQAAKPTGARLAGAAIMTGLAAALVDGLRAEQARPAGRTAAVRLQRLVRSAWHAGAAILALARIANSGAFRAAFSCCRSCLRNIRAKQKT